MTPERWSQIESLFHRAAECAPTHRAVLLDWECQDDPDLRREVEALLKSEEQASDDMEAAVHGALDSVAYPLIGETISHYHILGGLGGGGMGSVYRAEDTKLGRQVALKFLAEETAKDSVALGRFEREARSASALEHPNICPIYEFGEHEGQPFLVMQRLQGRTLREVISAASPEKPSLPLDRLLDLAMQITSGLEAAHNHGIIHRDIKPANIFVTEAGQAKILDFGLAKLASGPTDEELDQPDLGRIASEQAAQDSSGHANPNPLLSHTGVAMGTASYMSPEQARGEKLDARTDLFSFGLVLYEMATGQRAFRGDTGSQVHDAVLHGKLNLRIPARLEAILRRALEKDRANRYQSAAEMRADLQGLKQALESRSLIRRWLPVSVVGLALIVGGILRFEQRQASSIHTLPDVRFRQLTINSTDDPVGTGSISPDGKYLAYVDQQGMHIRNMEKGATQPIGEPSGLPKDSVAWEIPDAAWLPNSTAFIANAHPSTEDRSIWGSSTTSIWLFSRSGDQPRQLRNSAMAWAVLRDGSVSYAANHERESWLIQPDGKLVRNLFDADENSQIMGPFAQSSADGHIILYGRHNASGDSILARDERGGPSITIFTPSETKRIPGGFAWLPDGRLIYQAVDQIFAYPSVQDVCNFWTLRLDLHTGKPLGTPQRMTNWTGFCSGGMNVTADGKHVGFLRVSPGLSTAYVAQLGAGGTRISKSRHLTLEEADDAVTDWTADSKAVILVSNRADHFEIYKQSLTADTSLLLASIPNGADEEATVSPDGKWIIVQTYPFSGPVEPNQIARIPIEGGTPESIFKVPELLGSFFCARPPSTQCVFADVSEDHKKMVVSNFDPIRGRGNEVARFEFDSKFNLNLNFGSWNISPDGKRFAVSRGPGGPIQIYSLSDHSIKLVQPKGRVDMVNLNWSADGNAFYFSNRTKGGTEILYMDLQGHTKSLWKNDDRSFCLPSPDGRFLAINDVKKGANYWMMENF